MVKSALSDLVIERLQHMIWLGEVRPGELMPPHSELAKRFGVGLSTVREAIKALSHKGMIEVVPGRGTLVLPEALEALEQRVANRVLFETAEAGDIFETRRVIESHIAGKTALRASEAELDEIDNCLQHMIGCRENIEEFCKASLKFHLSVARACKIKPLIEIYVLLQNVIEETIRATAALPGGVERTIANHSELLAAIKERDSIRAIRASDQEIVDVVDRLLLGRR